MDLSSLMSALQSEQKKQSSVRLSDRNVVELVMKLKQLGLFGDELLHTINGKEYITTDRLKADIQTALRQAGGRLELTELPALVGVDLVHCEKQVALIVEEAGGSILDAQGELITTQYFDSLAAEVNELLQESGVLSLADLAVSYSLNTELLRSTISSRMGTIIKGQLEGSLLYTPAYVRNIKAQLRGALRGTAAPVALTALVKSIGLEGFSSGQSMLAQLVEELVSEGAVQGSTKGGGGSWVPTVHTAAQQSAVAGFYSQNGWVAYDLVRKAGISNEKTFLGQKFPEGIALDTVFVSPSLIAQTEASVDETLRNGSWLDVATVLPPSLGAADVKQLLDKCGDLARDTEHKRGQVLATTCVVSAALIEGAKQKVEEFAKQEADKTLHARRSSSGGNAAGAAGASSNGSGEAAAAAAGGKKSAAASPARQRPQQPEPSGADSDDDWSMGGGGKKGKKGKAATGGKGGKGKGASSNNSSSSGSAAGGGGKQQKGGGAADVNSLLGVGVLAQQVLKLYPDMDDAGPSGSLPKAIAEVVRPAAVAAYQEALASVLTSGAVAKKKAKEGALKSLEEAFVLLQLYANGAELLQDDEATLTLVQRHLLRGTATEALDALLSWSQLEFADDDATAAAAAATSADATASSSSSSWTPATRSKLVKSLPPEVGQPLGKALEATGATDPQDFVSKLEAAAQECGIRLKRLDKKSEKAACTAHKARLLQLLHDEQSPAAVLALVLPLLVLKCYHKLMSIPGRAIGGVLVLLLDKLEPEQHALVQQFHELVVDSLKAAAAGSEGSQGDAKVQELVPQVKTLAGVEGSAAAEA